MQQIQQWMETADIWLTNFSKDPMAFGKAGVTIVFLYCTIFFLVGLVRGKLWLRRGEDGNFHVRDWLVQLARVEQIPLIFLGMGILPFIMAANCIVNPEEMIGVDCRDRDADCDSCYGIAVYSTERAVFDIHRTRSDIRWIPSLANAYGYGVVKFQILAALAVALAAIVGIGWLIAKLAALVALILRPIVRFIARQLRKIPIRI